MGALCQPESYSTIESEASQPHERLVNSGWVSWYQLMSEGWRQRSIMWEINHAYLMEPPLKLWISNFGEYPWLAILWCIVTQWYCEHHTALTTWTQLCPPFLFDFNLHHSAVINYDCEYNRFQWILWILLAHFWIWG